MSNWNKDMTVREAFEKAFGPMPAGATCHIAGHNWSVGVTLREIIWSDDVTYIPDDEEWLPATFSPIGEDASNLPAWVFAELGIYGYKFNQAVRQ